MLMSSQTSFIYSFLSFLVSCRCTVDPYLFQNFETSDEGNSLRAQFKAFKFPESNFVLFKGTVNVCLDKCGGVSHESQREGESSSRQTALSS